MSDSKTRQGGEPLQIDGGPLGQLHFAWENDRYHHQWLSAEGATILRSAESSTPWPSSPPMQQIHHQSFADGRDVIFGVGMAGRGHWSASFTLVPDLKCWIVELACRSPVVPEALASTYDMVSEWYAAEDSSARSKLADTTFSLEPLAPACLTFNATDKNLLVAPSSVPDKATTTQWAFRLRIG